MAAIQVKDVPEDLHERARRRAREEGMTLSAYVLDTLRRDLSRPSRRAWLEMLHSEDTLLDLPPAADLIRAERDERERYLAERTDPRH